MNDPSFDANLAAAIANPKSRAGRAFLKKILPLLAISAAPVKWSAGERGACISRMLAMARRFGPPSCFLTIAPDDVHDPTSIRLALTHASNSEFPAVMDSFLEALRTRSSEFQHQGSSLFGDNMEDTLQRLAASHPGATSMMYGHMMRTVMATLFGLPPAEQTRKSVPIDARESFLAGTPVAFFAVTETSGRKALHMHCLIFGGAMPDLLSAAAKHEELLVALRSALASQYCCELPLEIHVAERMRRVLKVAARRPVAQTHPPVLEEHSNEDEPVRLSSEFLRDAHLTVAALQIHICNPKGACGKKPSGECGCRFGMPCGHPVTETRAVRVRGKQPDERKPDPSITPHKGLCTNAFCTQNTGSMRLKWQEVCGTCPLADDSDDEDAAAAGGEEAGSQPLQGSDCETSEEEDEQQEHREADATDPDGRRWAKYKTLVPRASTFEEDCERVGSWLTYELKRDSLWPDDAPIEMVHNLQKFGDMRALQKWLRALSADELKTKFEEMFASMPAEVHTELERVEWAEVKECMQKATAEQRRTIIVQWCQLQCANASVTAFGHALTAAVRCNTAHLLLGAREPARNAMFYMVKYLTKDSTELSASLAVLTDVRQRCKKWESRAEDSNIERRNALYFLQKAVNRLHGELSDTQAAALLLGDDAHFTSEAFVWGAPWQVYDYAQLLDEPHADGFDDEADGFEGAEDDEDDDEYDYVGARSEWVREQQAQQDSGPGYSKAYTDAEGNQVPVTLAQHYRYRGRALAAFNYMEWQACVNVVPIPEGENTEDRTGRRGAKMSGCFPFHPAHPLHTSHWQQIRRKIQCVMHTGPMPPMEGKQLGAGKKVTEKWLLQRWKFATYMLANFVPWAVDEDEAEGNRPLSLSPESLEEWIEATKATAAVVAEPATECAAHERTVARGRMYEMRNYVHALAVSKDAKRILNIWRMRNRRGWTQGETDTDDAASGAGAAAAEVEGEADKAAKAAENRKRKDAEVKKHSDPEKIKKRKEQQQEHQRWIDLQLQRQGLSMPPADDVFVASAVPAAGVSGGAGSVLQVDRNKVKHLYEEMLKFPFDAVRAGICGQSAPAAHVERCLRAAPDVNIPDSDWMPAEIRTLTDAEHREAIELWVAAKTAARATGAVEPMPPLNTEQRKIAQEILKTLFEMEKMHRRAPAGVLWQQEAKQLPRKQILLNGAAGTGKTLLIRRLEEAMASLGLGRMALTAYAGSACVELGNAITTLSMLSIPVYFDDYELKEPTEAEVIKFENYVGLRGDDLQQLRMLVVDEVSMISPSLLHHIDMRLRFFLGGKKSGTERGKRPEDTGPFGGLILLAAGDFFQKLAVGSTSLHSALVLSATNIPDAKGVLKKKKLKTKGKRPAGQQVAGASVNGVSLFQGFNRKKLTVQNRFRDDPDYGDDLTAMRNPDSQFPVSERFRSGLEAQVLSNAEHTDPEWAFETIGVASNAERHYLNGAKIAAWAGAHGVPLLRWKLPLRSERAANLDRETTEALYEEEPSLWGYFAKGAPAYLTAVNKSQGRGLVNGTRVRLHSLTLPEGEAGDRVRAAVAQAGAGSVVTLSTMPLSMNVTPVVKPHFLERLRPFSLAGPTEDVVIPIMKESGTVKRTITSGFAAEELPGMSELLVEGHIVELGFAITDFKSQGKTMQKIILSLASRPTTMARLDISSVYVLASRVTTRAGLRTLTACPEAFRHLQKLRFQSELVIWDESYDEQGDFKVNLAEQAAKALGKKLAEREKVQKAENIKKKKEERQQKKQAERAPKGPGANRRKATQAQQGAKSTKSPPKPSKQQVSRKATQAQQGAKSTESPPKPSKQQVSAAPAAESKGAASRTASHGSKSTAKAPLQLQVASPKQANGPNKQAAQRKAPRNLCMEAPGPHAAQGAARTFAMLLGASVQQPTHASKSNSWEHNSCHTDTSLTIFETAARAAAEMLGRPFLHTRLPVHYAQANPPDDNPARAGKVSEGLLRWMMAREAIALGAPTWEAWEAAVHELDAARDTVRTEVNRILELRRHEDRPAGPSEALVSARVSAKAESFGSVTENMEILIGKHTWETRRGSSSVAEPEASGQAQTSHSAQLQGAAAAGSSATPAPRSPAAPDSPQLPGARGTSSARPTHTPLQDLLTRSGNNASTAFDFAGGPIARICTACGQERECLKESDNRTPLEYRIHHIKDADIRRTDGDPFAAFVAYNIGGERLRTSMAGRCLHCQNNWMDVRLRTELHTTRHIPPPLVAIKWEASAAQHVRLGASQRDAAQLESVYIDGSSTYQLVALAQFSAQKRHFVADVRGDGRAGVWTGGWTRVDGTHLDGRGSPIEPPTGEKDADGYVPILAIYCRTSQAAVRAIAYPDD